MRGIFSFTENKVLNLNSEEFESRLQSEENPILIDVRTPQENAELRIPNSKLINLMNPGFVEEIEKLDKKSNIYLYCRSRNRSLYAGREMVKMGFENVINLSPGIIGWSGKTESGLNG